MNYMIRTPSFAETPGLYQLIQDHATFEKSAASLTAVDLEALLSEENEAVRFIVAADGEHLLGYAAVTFDWSVWRAQRYAHLDCLFVSQTHRGRGIGMQLFAGAKAVASSEGLDRMEWQTPLWNEDAVRFYVREGASFQTKARFNIAV